MHVKDLFDLSGKVAVVTGGAGYLGFQMAEGLAEAGAHVVLAARRDDACREKAAWLSQDNARALGLKVDVTDEASVDAMVDSVLQEFGRLDVLVNNAASYVLKYLEDTTLEEWKRSLDCILTSVFICSKAALGPMKAQGGGSIVNIASIYGVVSPNRQLYTSVGRVTTGQYVAGKAGIINFSRYCAVSWATHGVRVNCISPGLFPLGIDPDAEAKLNERCPIGRMGNDTDLKGAVVYLASPASAYVTGHNLVVDGGWTIW